MEKNILAKKRNVPATLQAMKGFAEGAAANAAKATQYFAELNSQRGLKRTEMERHIATADGDPKKAREFYEADFAAWSKKHTAESEKERYALVAALEDSRMSVSEARSFLTNPIVIASNFELGEPRRSAIEATLNGQGPGALRTMMARAEAANDKTAIAALILKNDSLPRNERTFSSIEKAEAAFGEEAAKAKAYIADIEAHAANALAANRLHEGQKVNRISLALTHGDRLKLPRQPESIAGDKKPVGFAARKAMQDADAE